MRSLAVVAGIALLGLAATAEAGGRHHHAGHRAHRATLVSHRSSRVAIADKLPVRGQSSGVPWAGALHDAAELPAGDGYVIRRPWRAFGTREAVDFIEQVVNDVRDRFPDRHVLAIGDLSAQHGGQITEHRSHQSGRDVDIGLFYQEKPANYPHDFVRATADNLDCAATYALLSGFASTAKHDGGAQIIFLDYDVQGVIYRWAQDHGVDDAVLERIFQYPRGRSDASGLVRHYPGHDNHMHVRFKCPDTDASCR